MIELFKQILPWLLPLEVFIIGSVVIFVARYFLIKKNIGLTSQTSIIRQTIFFLITMISGLMFIISMPISETLKGQILSLFGIACTGAVALSSTTFVGNAMAGFMLKIIDTIEPGDYIKSQTQEGRVTEQRLLYTEIQTEDRNLITIPNLFLVNNPVEIVRASGTIISATVSLGYDIPRVSIETQLIKAGKLVGLSDPFVQILDLGDFSVKYRLAGILEDTKHIISTYSKLRAAMLDALHEAKIEIVSPTFMNQRVIDKTKTFIPFTKNIEMNNFGADDYEKLIFDKANIAQIKEKLKTMIQKNEVDIEALKATLKTALADDKVEIEKKIEKLKIRNQHLHANIGALEAEDAN